MASKIITKGLKRTALSVALGMCFAGSVYAQSNSTGSIAGTTTAGGTVVIENPATGFRREVTADASGGYRVGIAADRHLHASPRAARPRRSTSPSAARPRQPRPSTPSPVVGGRRHQPDRRRVGRVDHDPDRRADRQDPGSARHHLAWRCWPRVPCVATPRSATWLRSAVRRSPRTSTTSTASTSPTRSATSTSRQVPFEAIAEQQIKTGGYGAEFGRSLGGVINLVTKRGTNEFHAGGNIFWSPESLRETQPGRVLQRPALPGRQAPASPTTARTALAIAQRLGLGQRRADPGSPVRLRPDLSTRSARTSRPTATSSRHQQHRSRPAKSRPGCSRWTGTSPTATSSSSPRSRTTQDTETDVYANARRHRSQRGAYPSARNYRANRAATATS